MKWQNLRVILFVITAITFIFASPLAVAKASPGGSSDRNPSVSVQARPSAPVVQLSFGLKRIKFAPGTTSAVVSGELSEKIRARYVLRALEGQLMDVSLSAPQGVKLMVTTMGGRALTALTSSSTSFRGYLPKNGDYLIVVTSRSRHVSYSINIMIPERISFERGATSATVEGEIDAFQSHDYILRAMAGQLMEVNVTPEDADASLQLIIYGVDGSVLRSGMGEGSFFRGQLPLSEDYIVSVRAGDQDVSYSMNVIIPRRITFAAGAVSASESGKLSAFHSQYYVLRALKNQTMKVNVTSSEDVQLIIYGADGTVLRSGMGEGASFSGDLPSTQDYILVVRAGPDAARYTLRVTIK